MFMNHIIKRNGLEVAFDRKKIFNAIQKAFESCNIYDTVIIEGVYKDVLYFVKKEYSINLAHVEDIQDIIEKVLIKNNHSEVAKSFIIYREKRKEIRSSRLISNSFDASNLLNNTSEVIEKYGRTHYKDYNTNHVISKDVLLALNDNKIMIHDMDYYDSPNSFNINLEKFFQKGFELNGILIRKPRSITSYFSLTVLIMHSLAKYFCGCFAISSFDFLMAEGVRLSFNKYLTQNLMLLLNLDKKTIQSYLENVKKSTKENILDISNLFINTFAQELNNNKCSFDLDELKRCFDYALNNTKNELYQASEGFLHSLNVQPIKTSSKNPLPSISYGLDTSTEGKMVINAILDASYEGIGKKTSALSPIQNFIIKKGLNFNKNDLNYKEYAKAYKVLIKRNTPRFIIFDAESNFIEYNYRNLKKVPVYFSTGERMVMDKDDSTYGAISLSTSLINLVKLANDNKDSIEEFFNQLKLTIDLLKDQQIDKYERIKKGFILNLDNILSEGEINDKNILAEKCRINLSFIGLGECLTILNKSNHAKSKTSELLGMQIILFIKNMLNNISIETGYNFSLCAINDIHASYRFCMKDKKKINKKLYSIGFNISYYSKISYKKRFEIEGKYSDICDSGAMSTLSFKDHALSFSSLNNIINDAIDKNIQYLNIQTIMDKTIKNNLSRFYGYVLDENNEENKSIINQFSKLVLIDKTDLEN